MVAVVDLRPERRIEKGLAPPARSGGRLMHHAF